MADDEATQMDLFGGPPKTHTEDFMAARRDSKKKSAKKGTKKKVAKRKASKKPERGTTTTASGSDDVTAPPPVQPSLPQREISVSSSSPRTATCSASTARARRCSPAVKEAVDNSLDACEEAGILPELLSRSRRCPRRRSATR
jgi:hypothetical protein